MGAERGFCDIVFSMSNVKKMKLIWIFSLTSMLVMSIIALLLLNPPSWKFSVCGGLIGCLSSVIVLFSYRYSASMYGTSFDLLVIRSACDLGLALRFLFEPFISQRVCGYRTCYFNGFDDFQTTADKNQCSFPTAVMEFFEISSEAWFLCLAFEFSKSLSDPFSTFKQRFRKYVFGAFGVGLLFSLVVGLDSKIYGFWLIAELADDSMFCWIQSNNKNPLPWFLFYVPIVMVYFYSLYTIFKSYFKLREGISSTFKHRIKALVVNSANICVCAIYWSSLFVMYLATEYYLIIRPEEVRPASQLYKLMLFTLAAKGSVDLYVWIIIVDGQLLLGEKLPSAKDYQSHDLTPALREEVLHCTTAGVRLSTEKSRKATEYHSKITHYLEQIQSPNPEIAEVVSLKRFTDILFNYGEEESKEKRGGKELSGNELDTVVESPMLQMSAKRNSSLYTQHLLPSQGDNCPTALAASKHYSIERKDDIFYKSNFELFLIRARLLYQRFFSRERLTEGFKKNCLLYMDSWNLAGEKKLYQITFDEYEPYWFRKIRRTFIDKDDRYEEEFLSTVKARLVEGGASGAFFFFSRREKFIAKSCTSTEIAHLREYAEIYSNYITTNQNTYISRIYGVYQLRIYGTSLYFYVMNNIFLNKNNETINEKYDIKGSFVNRNAKLPRNGQSCICARCNQKFTYYSSNRKGTKNNSRKNTFGSFSTTTSTPTNEKSRVKALTESTPEDSGEICKYSVNGDHTAQVVMKDNDLREKIRLPPVLAYQVYRQLKEDAKFLHSLGVMDYSLLIGVHTTEYDMEQQRDLSISRHSSTNWIDGRRLQVNKVVGPASYYMGIIDFLQKYDVNKRFERFSKVYFMGKSATGLSAVEPTTYYRRFMLKCREILLDSEADTQVSSMEDDIQSDDDDASALA